MRAMPSSFSPPLPWEGMGLAGLARAHARRLSPPTTPILPEASGCAERARAARRRTCEVSPSEGEREGGPGWARAESEAWTRSSATLGRELERPTGVALHGPPAVAAQHPAQVMRTSPRPQRARLLLLLPLPPDASIV